MKSQTYPTPGLAVLVYEQAHKAMRARWIAERAEGDAREYMAHWRPCVLRGAIEETWCEGKLPSWNPRACYDWKHGVELDGVTITMRKV